MAPAFLACTGLGVPILSYGDYDEVEWLNMAKLTATIGGIQNMDGFRFNSHGKEFSVKPFLSSYHKFYCVVIRDDIRCDSILIAYTIGHAVDILLHDSMASVLTYLDKKAEIEQQNSTFANRSESEVSAMEDCLNVLFSTPMQKDMILYFEQYFIPRALLPSTKGMSSVYNWFTPLRDCSLVTELYLLEWVADGENVSDFIAAAGQCKFSISSIYAEHITATKNSTVKESSQQQQVFDVNAPVRELVSLYLKNYAAGVAGSPERQRIMTAPDANTRVACLGNGTSVWMSVVSPKLVLVVHAATSGVAAVGGVVRCIVRLGEAYPDNLRNSFQQCTSRLTLAFPTLDSECPKIPGDEIFSEMLGVRIEY